jgi:uncharacterized protein (TIGR02285 family)
MKRCRFRAGTWFTVLWLLGSIAFVGVHGVMAEESPLPLLVFDRPPYYVLERGRPAGGFVLDIAMAVFAQAGIPVTVQDLPPGRILALFESRAVRACAVGWFQTAQRAAHARFSLPLYTDQPLGVVVRPDTAQALGEAPSLAELLSADLNWGLRQGFSHGPVIDAAFGQARGVRFKHFADTRAMLRLLALGRLDAVLLGPEELSTHLDAEPDLAGRLRFVTIRDAPPGLDRYLMCGRAVPAQLMARIDAAIMDFRLTHHYRQLTHLRLSH